MATIAKTKYLGPGPALRRRQEKAERRAAARPDYFGLAVVILLMAAIMALAIWLASLGGGAAQPIDHWIMMP
jgi:hypothetical protein